MINIEALSIREIEDRLQAKQGLMELLDAMRTDPRKAVQKLYAQALKKAQKEAKEQERILHLYQLEQAYYAQGLYEVAGVDEAGRGPVAGPVAIAAVILPPYWLCQGLNDSKKISAQKRDVLYDKILKEAIAVSCIMKEREEIDRLNIYQATQQGMYDAIAALSVSPQAVLIDAMPLPKLTMLHQSPVHGDALSASIAAASIVAKVTRDRCMQKWDVVYPQYGFAIHKGYLTQAHRDAIMKFGPCPLHRRSFEPIKSMVKDDSL